MKNALNILAFNQGTDCYTKYEMGRQEAAYFCAKEGWEGKYRDEFWDGYDSAEKGIDNK